MTKAVPCNGCGSKQIEFYVDEPPDPNWWYECTQCGKQSTSTTNEVLAVMYWNHENNKETKQ